MLNTHTTQPNRNADFLTLSCKPQILLVYNYQCLIINETNSKRIAQGTLNKLMPQKCNLGKFENHRLAPLPPPKKNVSQPFMCAEKDLKESIKMSEGADTFHSSSGTLILDSGSCPIFILYAILPWNALSHQICIQLPASCCHQQSVIHKPQTQRPAFTSLFSSAGQCKLIS